MATAPSICKYEDILKTDKIVINTTPFVSSTSVPFVFSSDTQEAVISVDFHKKEIVTKILVAGDNFKDVSLVIQVDGVNQTENLIYSSVGVSIKVTFFGKNRTFPPSFVS